MGMPSRAWKNVNNSNIHKEHPEAFAAVVSGAGGALCFGSIGALVGATVFSAMGFVAGILPAVFMFGLSMPVGAIIGGAGGIGVGGAIGGSAGFAGFGSIGYAIAYFRTEIRHAMTTTAAKLNNAYNSFRVASIEAVRIASERVRNGVSSSAEFTKKKSCGNQEHRQGICCRSAGEGHN